MSREECIREMAVSMAIGNVITILLFAFLHENFKTGEAVGFLLGTWFVATYAVWSVIDWNDRRKSRDAVGRNHGKSSIDRSN